MQQEIEAQAQLMSFENRFATKQMAQAEQYSLKNVQNQKTKQAQQYFLERRFCKTNNAGTAIFPQKTDLQKTAQAQKYFVEKRICLKK